MMQMHGQTTLEIQQFKKKLVDIFVEKLQVKMNFENPGVD
jgi:hypothetical protein